MQAVQTKFIKLKESMYEIVQVLEDQPFRKVYLASSTYGGKQRLVTISVFDSAVIPGTSIDHESIAKRNLAVSQLNHPNIVCVLDVEHDEHGLKIVEEYLQGGRLSEAIALRAKSSAKNTPMFTELDIAKFGIQLCDALSILHQNNQYHGFISPKCVEFRDSSLSQLVLVDFNHENILGTMDQSWEDLRVTLPFMAPEQTGFVKAETRAGMDLYSVGALLYATAAGHPPLDGHNTQELINKILSETPKPLSHIFRDFAVPLCEIISKLLRKSPLERYYSAPGLAADLQRCVSELSKKGNIKKFPLGSKDHYREINHQLPMLGREQESRKLLDLYQQSRQGESQFALIGSISGGGKSRLAMEIMNKARAGSSFTGYTKFSEYERNLPLSGLINLLRDHSVFLKSQTTDKIKSWQEKLIKNLGDRYQLLSQRFSFYGDLFPASHHNTKADLNTIEMSELFNHTMAEFLCLLPVGDESEFVLIDDLQWADVQSLQILGILARLTARKQVAKTMFVCTYRSDEVPLEHAIHKFLFPECAEANFVRLATLSKDCASQIVECLLEESGPEVNKLQDIAYRITSGNPFHIQEFIKQALRSGIFNFDERNSTWIASEEKVNNALFTRGIRALVGHRLQSLSPICQALLSIASVSGHSMKRSTLAKLLPLLLTCRNIQESYSDSKNLDQAIELAYQDLLQKNLIVPNEDSFVFFHDKIQEAAFELLLPDEILLLNHWLGLWYVETFKSISNEGNEEEILKGAYHLSAGSHRLLDHNTRSFLMFAAEVAHNIFAFDKERHYLAAVIGSIELETDKMTPEKFEALMAMANALVISEKISDAMALYDRLLASDSTPMQKAKIYAKKCQFSLNLFDYEQAREACTAGLKCLGLKIITNDISAILFVLVFSPVLMIYAVFFKYFGHETKTEDSEFKKVAFLLLIENQVPLYFTKPIIAIANHLRLSFLLMKYKESNTKIVLYLYWGVVASAFGLYRLSDKLCGYAYNYFDKTGDPLNKSYTLIKWAHQCDLMKGDLASTQTKLESGLEILAPIGEPFWRAVALATMIKLDYFGADTGEADKAVREYIELQRKGGFAPAAMGCLIRHFLQSGDSEQAEHFFKLSTESDEKLSNAGFRSIDSIYSLIGRGEYYEIKGDFESSSELFKRAMWIALSRIHRGPYPCFTPIVYARSLIHQRKLIKALLPIAVAWTNTLLLNVQLFKPHAFFITGYWLCSIGWKSVGQSLLERGIEDANRRGWDSIVAEGRLLLGRCLVDHKPSMAISILRLAKEYFSSRHWNFQIRECDRLLKSPSIVDIENRIVQQRSPSRDVDKNRPGGVIRNQVELKSLLDVLLKLSAISDNKSLFQAMMESLCHATGSEFSIIYLKEGTAWIPSYGYKIQITSDKDFSDRVAINFVENVLEKEPDLPVIFEADPQEELVPSPKNSAMMIPISYEQKIFGYCYLANSQLAGLYDEKSIEIAMPIASQSAVAFQNIALNTQLLIEKNTLAELHRTLEQRVIDQTRDIKSMMEHVQMGICTISGADFAINKDYSLYLEKILGRSSLSGTPLLPTLFGLSNLPKDEQDQVLNALRCIIGQPDFAFFINEHVLPRNLQGETSGGEPLILELDWIPINNDASNTERVLVTVHDVTQLRGLEKLNIQQDLELKILAEIVRCKPKEWERFITNCLSLSDQNKDLFGKLHGSQNADAAESILRSIFINLHTIKGNARAVGCKHLNETIHSAEQHFSNIIRNKGSVFDLQLLAGEIDATSTMIKKYQIIAEEKLGRNQKAGLSLDLDRNSFLGLFNLIESLSTIKSDAKAASDFYLNTLRDLLFRSAGKVFEEIFSSVKGLAYELEKASPRIEMELPRLWVTDRGEEILRNCFVHLLRNSLDHGIELPDERLKQSKPPEGCITLTGRKFNDKVELRVSDDGRGLNMKRLEVIARDRKLLTEEQIQDAGAVASVIFAPDVSTAKVVSDVSGRGIGMSAIQDYIQAAKGSISIEFTDNRPVLEGYRAIEFVIVLPQDFFQFEAAAAS